MGFADYAGGDYRLTRASKYKGLGTDGKDLGVDMDTLNKAIDMGSSGNHGAGSLQSFDPDALERSFGS